MYDACGIRRHCLPNGAPNVQELVYDVSHRWDVRHTRVLSKYPFVSVFSPLRGKAVVRNVERNVRVIQRVVQRHNRICDLRRTKDHFEESQRTGEREGERERERERERDGER